MDAVRKTVLKLKPSDINRIESNGSIALYAASFYGQASVVRFLLENGVDTTITTNIIKTAKEQASTNEIRTIFEEADDDEIPQSECVQLF
jgi:ankyrin repeat protein